MNESSQKYLILTCDSEAVPSAAPDNHIDRLIWGRFPQAPYEAGIGKMMDIADEFGVKMVFFHDVLEEHSYGNETGGAARYIVARGHDLQLHMHTEFLPPEFWARLGYRTPTWSMNLYNAETARQVMEHGIELFENMVGFKPVAYRAGAFRYNARILEALETYGIPLSFQYYPPSAQKQAYPHGFDAGVLPVFKWNNGVIEVPLAIQENPYPHQPGFRYTPFELNQLPGGTEQAHALMRQFWDNGPTYTVCVMILHSWSFLRKNESGHYVWEDDSLVRFFTDFLKTLPLDVQVITATELLTKVSQREVVPVFELPIQVAGTEGIPLLSLSQAKVPAAEPETKSVTHTPLTEKSKALETQISLLRTKEIAGAVASHEEHMRESRRRLVESHPYPHLDDIHVRGARLLASRSQLLENLPKHGSVCELGVAQGDFSAEILQRCEPASLHLIDKWDEAARQKVVDRFATAQTSPRVLLHVGTPMEKLAEFPDHSFDWVYIDTTHDYRTTAQELAICRAKVKTGGIIAGHDHTPGNIVTPVCYGVVQAVQEFCVKYSWRYLFLTCESHCYASFAIQEIDTRTLRHDRPDAQRARK